MTTEEQREILNLLDGERQAVIYPGVTRFWDEAVVRDVAADGKSAEVVYSSCSEEAVDLVISHEIERARSAPYELEWKVYGHDQPGCLADRLTEAGFVAGEKEAFMVFSASKASLERFGACDCDIRRVKNNEELQDYRKIREEVSGARCDKEIERYAFMLENHPSNMSVYVAYVDEEPAACGRIYFHEESEFAGLYGGSTRERFRKRGLFTQLVAARIRETVSRGIKNVCVDALPTSEPILRKRGFDMMTYTQPFSFVP